MTELVVAVVIRTMRGQENEMRCGPLQEDLSLKLVSQLLGSAADSCPEQLKVFFFLSG